MDNLYCHILLSLYVIFAVLNGMVKRFIKDMMIMKKYMIDFKAAVSLKDGEISDFYWRRTWCW